jgi:lipopolysaccharide export system ATP-binding protein
MRHVAILEIKDIVKQYKRRRVVDGISLRVETGSVVGLLGPNGAGKTTTFYSIAGFIHPDAGSILLDGKDLTRFPIHQRARQGLSYLAQEASVFKKLTVRENVQIILETLGLAKDEITDKITRLMAELRITHLADHFSY